MFKKATSWELKLGRVASIIFTVLFIFLFLNYFVEHSQGERDYFSLNFISYCLGFLFYSLILTSWLFYENEKRDEKFYPIALMMSAITINLAMFADFHFGHIVAVLTGAEENIKYIGRSLYYQFVPVPVLIIFALFHIRIWAICLFLLLSVSPIIFKINGIISHPSTFFTSSHEQLNNGFAMDESFLGFSIIICAVATVFSLGFLYFFRYALNSVQKSERNNLLLGRYFSPDVRKEIEQSNFDFQNQEPKDLEVAIMFTDIVGFTKLSEKMAPKDVMRLLSEYQKMMVDAIFENNGTVDKFIGDAVMANFGTPKSRGNDAQNAFDCAAAMNQKLAAWNGTRKEQKLIEIDHRIGIHYGPCVVGNIGGEQRAEFAVIGDVVNVASRICDACKEFDTNFLISSDLERKIQHTFRKQVDNDYQIRGRSDPIDVVKIYDAV